MSQFHFQSSTHSELTAAEVPACDELHERLAAVIEGVDPRRALVDELALLRADRH
ncbi:MAG: hypothetical protein ACJ77E_18360 [Gaiellaceae bacterium]